MAEQFYTILTNIGKAKIANSLPTGQKVNLTKMKIGDSNGTYYNPSENQTELVHKVYECNVTSVDVDENNPSWITITSVVPSDIGGFSIREVGIFDDTNSLIAIGKYPETYKPIASDGSTKELYIKMTLEVTNASSVELKIDPTVILATKKDISNLDAKIEQNNSQLNDTANKIKNINDAKAEKTELNVVNEYAKNLNDIKANKSEIESIKNKVDSFQTAQDVSENKDMEIVGCRTDNTGFAYATADKRISEIENKSNSIYSSLINKSYCEKIIDLSLCENKYIDTTGECAESSEWKLYDYIEVIGGTTVYYIGRLYGIRGGIGLYDKDKKFIKLVTSDTEEKSNLCVEIYLPQNCKYIKPAFCTKGLTDLSNWNMLICYLKESLILENSKTIMKIFKPESSKLENKYQKSDGSVVNSDNWRTSTNFINLIGNKKYLYRGALLGKTAGMCFFGKNDEVVGFFTSPFSNASPDTDIIYESIFYAPENAVKMNYSYLHGYEKNSDENGIYMIEDTKEDTFKELDYDVCIVGGGAGGIGTAYALKDSGLNVCLIDKNNMLGGNHVNAWVNVHATTPAPPFLKNIVDEMMQTPYMHYVNKDYGYIDNSSVQYTDTLIRKNYRADYKDDVCICYDPIPMGKKYYSDLKPTISIKLNTNVVNVEKKGTNITAIYTDKNEKINAKIFIDCTANDDLIQMSKLELLTGEESSTFFNEEYGFIESNAPSVTNKDIINAPTLMYRVENGSEDLSSVISRWTNDAGAYENKINSKIYMNSIDYLKVDGAYARDDNASAYNMLKQRALEHWKTIKNGGSPRFEDLNLTSKKFDKYADMLGVRETYRIKAERMLNENDLYVKIKSDNIKTGDNLNKKIACGNHICDFHGTTNVNINTVNQNIRPYGVPYGCLIPKGLSNVLVASRGAGLTHLASGSFRLNKDMMQLGWASGKACEIFIIDELDDFRNVDVEKLQSKEFTDFENTVQQLETIIAYS